MRPTYRSAPVLSPATISTVLTTFAKGTPPHLRNINLSSPDSIYSSCSPAFPHYLSDSEGEDIEHYEEEDYDAILAAAGPSWGKWNQGDSVPDWLRQDAPRRRSIIAISPRGSSASSRSRGSKYDRHGSDPSLLGFDLAKRNRRRSSGLSISTTASVDPAEARRMRNFASLEGIGRRFSEVVEVTVPSDNDEDYATQARAAFADQWSPESMSSEDSDDVSEVRTAPYFPTPPVVAPVAYSNFPLQSFAPVASTPQDSRDNSPTPIFHRYGRPVRTPSPPMAPADYLRARTRAPIIATSTAHAKPTVMERPRPAFARSVSTPFFSAPAPPPPAAGLLPAHVLVPSMTLGKSSLYHSMRRPSLAKSDDEDAPRRESIGLGIDHPALSRRASISDVPSLLVTRGSLIEGAADFAYLASEIQVESDPSEETPRPPFARRPPSSITMPCLTFEPATACSTPFTPRFNPMDSFLGIVTPPPAWSAASSPRSPSPTRHVRWSSDRYPFEPSHPPIAGPSKRVTSARKPVPSVNVAELDHTLAEASVSRATLRRGAVASMPVTHKRRSLEVQPVARPQVAIVRPPHTRSRSDMEATSLRVGHVRSRSDIKPVLSHRISMPVITQEPVQVPIRPTARRTTSTSSFTRFFRKEERPALRSHLSDSSGSSGSDRTMVEVRDIFRKLGVSSPKSPN